MNEYTRDRLRKLQDDWLALPRVRRAIADRGWDGMIADYFYATSNPSFRDVRAKILPAWEGYFRDDLKEARDEQP